MPTLEVVEIDDDKEEEIQVVAPPPQSSFSSSLLLSSSPPPVAAAKKKTNKSAPATVSTSKKTVSTKKRSSTGSAPADNNGGDTNTNKTALASNKKSKKIPDSAVANFKGQLKLGAFFVKASTTIVEAAQKRKHKKNPLDGLSEERKAELKGICLGKSFGCATPKRQQQAVTSKEKYAADHKEGMTSTKNTKFVSPNDDNDRGAEPNQASKTVDYSNNEDHDEVAGSEALEKAVALVNVTSPYDSPMATEMSAEKGALATTLEELMSDPASSSSPVAEQPAPCSNFQQPRDSETETKSAIMQMDVEESQVQYDKEQDVEALNTPHNVEEETKTAVKESAASQSQDVEMVDLSIDNNKAVSKEEDVQYLSQQVEAKSSCQDNVDEQGGEKQDLEEKEGYERSFSGNPEDNRPSPRTNPTNSLSSPPSRQAQAASRRKNKAPAKKQLDNATQQELAKYRSRKDTLISQAKELLRACYQRNDDKGLTVPVPQHGENVAFDKATFPDFAVSQLCARIEGRSAPLTTLAEQVTIDLNQAYGTDCFVKEVTTEKIMLLASRKQNIKSPEFAMNEEEAETFKSTKPDPHQDDRIEFLWRWEVDMVQLLPDECQVAAKKARIALRKAVSPVNTIVALIRAIVNLEKALLAGQDDKNEKLLDVVRQNEEKVQKVQADEENERSKRKREVEEKHLKNRKRDEQQKLKLKLAEEKRRQKLEAEEKKQHETQVKQLKKDQAAKEKEAKKQAVEEAKRIKELEKRAKEEELKKAEQEKRAEIEKQANIMNLFFVKKRQEKKLEASTREESATNPAPPSSIISQISGQDKSGSFVSLLPMKLTEEAKKHRRPRCRMVERTVFVTAQECNDNPWATDQPFAEETTIRLRSLFKHLCFGEEHRPAYYGTWSKKSDLISGRRPFAKDTKHFDYDYDSADDWEEGDDEIGEELDDDEDEEVEPDDDEKLLAEDAEGWRAGDDDMSLGDEADDETRLLRKKMRMEQKNRTETALLLIGPAMGGRPLATLNDCGSATLEGTDGEVAIALLHSHKVITVVEVTNDAGLVSAFPPSLTDDVAITTKEDGEGVSPDKNQNLTDEEMKTFLTFVHNSTLPSKEKVVDQLKEMVPRWSRSMTLKTLETVAEKKKHPAGGHLWQVKRDLLDNLGLSHLPSSSTEELKKEYLRKMALLVHHSTASSKDKLVEELLVASSLPDSAAVDGGSGDTSNNVVTKAECQRLVEELGSKVKAPNGSWYWEIKEERQRELDLNLRVGPPPQLS